MKFLPVILLVLFELSSITAANESRYPLKSTSEWKVNYEEMDYDTIHWNGDEIIKFYFENDTLINSILYFKLYKTGFAYYDQVFPFNNVYVGAIRDEDDKIYYVEKNMTTEDLLYDFNINIGDTIKSLVEKDMEVTSIEILNDGRKKINIRKTNFLHGKCENYNNTYLIEGVGSMGGIFYECPCNHIGFREHYLVCYSENGNLVYQSNLSPVSCNATASIDDYASDNYSIIVCPVPSRGNLMLKFQDFPDQYAILSILDISGSMVYFQKLQIENYTTEINLLQMKKGIYILRITNDNSSFTKKIILE